MRLIKMVSVGKSSMGWDGKPFWGLVVQKGPWKSTPADVARAKQKDDLTIGGGIPVGGRMSGQRSAVMTPYQIDASGAPPEPSDFAKRSIVVGAIDMKRQGARGTRMKSKMTLGARTPVQTGHKMGSAPEEGGPGIPPSGPVLVPPEEIPDLLAPSDISMYHSVPELNGSFESQHHIEEMADKLIDALEGSSGRSSSRNTHEFLKDIWGIPKYTQSAPTVMQAASQQPSSRSMSIDARSAQSPHDALMRLAASQGIYPKSSSSMSVDTPYEKSSMSVDTPRSAAYIEQYPQVPEFAPISQPKLELTQDFLQSLADYQNAEAEARKEKMEARKEKMERMDVDEPIIFEKPAAVDLKRGKKVAMDRKVLGKEADIRGLPATKAASSSSSRARKARPTTEPKPKKEPVAKAPKPKKQTTTAKAFKPKQPTETLIPKKPPPAVVKKKSMYQRVNAKTVNLLIKKFGGALESRLAGMKEDDVQYLITKAALEKYKKDAKNPPKKGKR
jgi:hypothetical protein